MRSDLDLEGYALTSLAFCQLPSENDAQLRDLRPLFSFLTATSLTTFELELFELSTPDSSLQIPHIQLPAMKEFTLSFVSASQDPTERDMFGQLRKVYKIPKSLHMPNLSNFTLDVEISRDYYPANRALSEESNQILEDVVKNWFPAPSTHHCLSVLEVDFNVRCPTLKRATWIFPIDVICNAETFELSTSLNASFTTGNFKGPSRLKRLTINRCSELHLLGVRSLIAYLESVGAFVTLETLEIKDCLLLRDCEDFIRSLLRDRDGVHVSFADNLEHRNGRLMYPRRDWKTSRWWRTPSE